MLPRNGSTLQHRICHRRPCSGAAVLTFSIKAMFLLRLTNQFSRGGRRAGALLAVTAIASARVTPPNVDLPDGMELVVAAAPPLVNFPIMGCIDDRGRLFVGDAAGLNLARKELEEQLPNRVLMLEDIDGDGVYDRHTVFADRMTFPQGACWLGGSLYVASPPGIWKLTDQNGDGVADRREMIVGGFDYTGNAADVHGPFLHPNGRLFWCHGRKGHKVVQKDGTLVHEGKASGIWSCRPDGSDVQWHALGCMDNPVEVDFADNGGIFGVVNLYYNQPRGDTLIHWLYGGVYERPDQLNAIAGLPRTRDHMPVVHNFGHVAVSGCTFYRSGALHPAWRGDMFVSYFNTQKIVRAHLVPAGATYTATLHEFLKINDPDAHLTDVMEDADGSLLILNTGGWFRIGCPSSLIEKPDLRGAIYRVRPRNAKPVVDPLGLNIAWSTLPSSEAARLMGDSRWMVRREAAAAAGARPRNLLADLQDASQPRLQLDACEAIAHARRIEPAQRDVLLNLIGKPLDPALEHAAMFAALATRCFGLKDLRSVVAAPAIRRLLLVLEQTTADATVQDSILEVAGKHTGDSDPELARTAIAVMARHPRSLDLFYDDFVSRLAARDMTPQTLNVVVEVATAQLARPMAQELVTVLLRHRSPIVRTAGWRVIARQAGTVTNPGWLEPLGESLTDAIGLPDGSRDADDAALLLLLDAVTKLASPQFGEPLRALVNHTTRSPVMRLKALGALLGPAAPIDPSAFTLLLQIAQSDSSPAGRVDAARLLSRARLQKNQLLALAPVLASAGPLELSELLKLTKRIDPAIGRVWAENLVKSPVFGAIEESAIRTAFSSLPIDVYEDILGPSVRAAAAAKDSKRRTVETLAASIGTGNARAGSQVFQASACVACHTIGKLGRSVGPDLSHIGQIRQPRDLIESIILPSATIARDYETVVVETSDGQSLTGMIKSDTPDGLRLIDFAGQEKSIPHAQIVATSVLSTSLMPMGLEGTFSQQQLLDLVAWLAALK